MKEIDARGLACPAPVLQTKAVVKQEDTNAVKVVVDNQAAQQNVERFLRSQGFETSLEKDGNDFFIMGTCSTAPRPQPEANKQADAEQKKIMVMCATDRIGFGDDDLGVKLMINFVRTLKEMAPDLWRLVLVNNGVKLAIDGSEVLQDLRELADSGIKILVCGTCLDHFKLLEKKQVGETTNMLDIVTAMQLADKIINI
jgi:selenium metabolism protein YedF